MNAKENYLTMLRGEIPEYVPSMFEPRMAFYTEEWLTPVYAPNGPVVTKLGVTYVGSPDNNFGAMPKPGDVLREEDVLLAVVSEETLRKLDRWG